MAQLTCLIRVNGRLIPQRDPTPHDTDHFTWLVRTGVSGGRGRAEFVSDN